MKKGHRDVDALRNDRGFDALRSRPDFGSLLAELVGRVAAKP